MLEVMAVDHWTGSLLMPPQSASVESEYNEQYVLWAGPVRIGKSLKKAEPILSDFTDLRKNTTETLSISQEIQAPYPFQHHIEQSKKIR